MALIKHFKTSALTYSVCISRPSLCIVKLPAGKWGPLKQFIIVRKSNALDMPEGRLIFHAE